MRTICSTVILCILLVLGPECRVPAAGGGLVLEEFHTVRYGAPILIPVTADREYCFAVDTGAAGSTLDDSLRRLGGGRLATRRFQVASGSVPLTCLEAPVLTIGAMQLENVREVALVDMSCYRNKTKQPIYGMIGMDALCGRVIRIDWEAGTLQVLASVPPDAGTRVPIGYDPWGRPTVKVTFNGKEQLPFIIDTGAYESDAILYPGSFEVLSRADALRGVRRVAFYDLLGQPAMGQKGICTAPLEIGGFAARPLMIGECPIAGGTQNVLGLAYLSRFIVTFDFANGFMYLVQGPNLVRSKLEEYGLVLRRASGQVIVHAVVPGSGVVEFGIERNDVLESIDGVTVGALDDDALCELLLPTERTKIAIFTDRDGGGRIELPFWSRAIASHKP